MTKPRYVAELDHHPWCSSAMLQQVTTQTTRTARCLTCGASVTVQLLPWARR